MGGKVEIAQWSGFGGALHEGPRATYLRVLVPLALPEQQGGPPAILAPWGRGEQKGRQENWFDQAVSAGPWETLGKADLGPEEEEEVGSMWAGFSMDGEQPGGWGMAAGDRPTECLESSGAGSSWRGGAAGRQTDRALVLSLPCQPQSCAHSPQDLRLRVHLCAPCPHVQTALTGSS